MKAKTTTLFSLLLVAVVVLTGCTPIAPPPVSTVPTESTTEANIALARRVFEEIWNEGALDVADEVFSPDVTYVGLIGNMPPGPESYKQYVAGYRAILPDIHYTIDDAIAQGDKVLLRWSGPATQMGELMGAPPSGKTAFVTGMFLCRMEDGKIVETWSNFDALGMFMQFGFQLVPPAVEEATGPEMSILIQGTRFHNANGIEFGPDDRLYIPSVVGREIVVMDPDTGEILDRFGPEMGVEGPDDLAFDAEGNMYWTGMLVGEVGKHSPSGEKTTVAQLPPGVNPITFSDDGRLFVGLCFMGDALYELDPAGVEEPRLIYENRGDGCGLNGMDWGPDGYLYGPRWFQNKVVRIDVESGEETTVADGFGAPAALNFDSQGRMVVLDTLSGEVVQVDISTGEKQVLAVISPGMDNLTFDSTDRLFVSSYSESYIVEVLPDGAIRTVSEGGLTAPGGVAILGDSLFVAEVLSVKEFDRKTGEQLRVEHDVIGVTALSAPFSVSTFGENLLLTSWFGNVIQLWNPESGEVLHNYTDIAVPIDAIAFQGDVLATELGTGSVVRFAADDPTQKSTVATGLSVPAGLAATEDALWVSDWAAGSVLQLVVDGEVLAEPAVVATGLVNPEGMAIAADGSLLVVETGAGQLTAIDPTTGETRILAAGLSVGLAGPNGYPPTNLFSGVAVDDDGVIYVTGDMENVVYRID
jgi:sugar lactone lactonase YvrE/predicted ester cyclase